VDEDKKIFEDYDPHSDVKAPDSIKRDVMGSVESTKNFFQFLDAWIGRIGTAIVGLLSGGGSESDDSENENKSK